MDVRETMNILWNTCSELVKLWRNDDAATAMEYAVLLGLIIIACFAALGTMTDALSGVFESVGPMLEIDA